MVLASVSGSRQSFWEWGLEVELWRGVKGVGADHVIDDASGFCDCGALETHVCHAGHELDGCDVFVSAVVVVEFGAFDHRDTFGNRC